MPGMNVQTGKAISDISHIWQSCRDILTTLVGTRIERREYGSLLPELIDHPNNEVNNLRLRAATVMALARWETRITIINITISISSTGAVVIDMLAQRTDQANNPQFNLNIPIGA